MHPKTLAAGIAGSSLFSGAFASPAENLGVLQGRMELGPAYLVPFNKTEDDYDVNAPWMVPIVDYVNKDANETVFDADGFDITPHDSDNSLQERAGETRFWLGKARVDYGCGGTIDSIRDILGSAVYALCGDGNCNSARNGKYVRKVGWMGDGSKRITRYLEITSTGKYIGPATLGNMHNIVKASVRRETVAWAWRKWLSPDWWVPDEECKMAKFPGYIGIDKGSPNQINDVEFFIKLNTVEADCFTTEVLSIVAGSIHSVLGAGFGIVHAKCNRR